MNPPEPLKDRARRLRENFRRPDGRVGLTQKELADVAGVSPTHVYQIERGLRSRMHLDTLTRYAKALGVSSFYLDRGYDEKPHDGSDWPTIEVTLRHTTTLDEARIGLVVRLVSALEAEQELERIESETSEIPVVHASETPSSHNGTERSELPQDAGLDHLDGEQWVSMTEATELVNLSRTSVRKRIQDGVIKGTKVNVRDTRYRLIPRSEIDRLLAEGRDFKDPAGERSPGGR